MDPSKICFSWPMIVGNPQLLMPFSEIFEMVWKRGLRLPIFNTMLCFKRVKSTDSIDIDLSNFSKTQVICCFLGHYTVLPILWGHRSSCQWSFPKPSIEGAVPGLLSICAARCVWLCCFGLRIGILCIRISVLWFVSKLTSAEVQHQQTWFTKLY